jgi:hypothetical protein
MKKMWMQRAVFLLGALLELNCLGNNLELVAIGCRGDSDCGSGQVCLDGTCHGNTPFLDVGPNQPQTGRSDTLIVEVTPPASSAYNKVRRAFGVFLGQLNPELELSIPAVYDVHLKDADGVEDKAAWLRFIPTQADATGPLPSGYTDGDTDSTVEMSGAVLTTGARFRLLDGNYTVRVTPTDPTIPSFVIQNLLVAPKTEFRNIPEEIELRIPERFRTLVGSVRRGGVPVAGVLVRAIAKVSGLPSTEAVSNGSGGYRILLPDTPETSFSLQARQRPSGSAELSVESTVVVALAQLRTEDITLPETPNTQTLQLTIETDSGVPVSNALVTLTSTTAEVAAGVAVWSGQGKTGRDGLVLWSPSNRESITVPFLPLRIDIAPPTDHPTARPTTLTFLANDLDQGLVRRVRIGERSPVFGRVQSAQGEPAPYAQLTFRSWGDPGFRYDLSADAEGRFQGALDQGVYLAVIRPSGALPNGELLPVAIRTVEILGEELPTLVLPSAAVVRGTIVGAPDRAPVGGAGVEFILLRANDAAISLAITQSDETGQFSAVLPNDLAAH